MHPSCTIPRKFSTLYSYLPTNRLRLESYAKSLSIFLLLLIAPELASVLDLFLLPILLVRRYHLDVLLL